MEAGFALEICIDLHDNIEFSIYVEQIVSDDDSTIRAHTQHAERGCKLWNYIHPPIFFTDPNHHIKVMARLF